jgi:hypothetical protein
MLCVGFDSEIWLLALAAGPIELPMELVEVYYILLHFDR